MTSGSKLFLTTALLATSLFAAASAQTVVDLGDTEDVLGLGGGDETDANAAVDPDLDDDNGDVAVDSQEVEGESDATADVDFGGDPDAAAAIGGAGGPGNGQVLVDLGSADGTSVGAEADASDSEGSALVDIGLGQPGLLDAGGTDDLIYLGGEGGATGGTGGAGGGGVVVLAQNGGAGGAGLSAPGTAAEVRVCFFEEANFQGDGVCAGAGLEYGAMPDGWDDRISSVSVAAGLAVQVCGQASFGGWCAELTTNAAQLPAGQDNDISSFRVYAR